MNHPPGNLITILRPQLNDRASPSAKPAQGFRTDGKNNRAELYDYQTDPDETRNQAVAHPEEVEALRKQLK